MTHKQFEEFILSLPGVSGWIIHLARMLRYINLVEIMTARGKWWRW